MIKKPQADELMCTRCHKQGHTNTQCRIYETSETASSDAQLHQNDFPLMASTQTSISEMSPGKPRKETNIDKHILSSPITTENRFESLIIDEERTEGITLFTEDPKTPTNMDESNEFTTAIDSPTLEFREKSKKKKNKQKKKHTGKRNGTPHPKPNKKKTFELQQEQAINNIARLFESANESDIDNNTKSLKRTTEQRSPDSETTDTKFYKVYDDTKEPTQATKISLNANLSHDKNENKTKSNQDKNENNNNGSNLQDN